MPVDCTNFTLASQGPGIPFSPFGPLTPGDPFSPWIKMAKISNITHLKKLVYKRELIVVSFFLERYMLHQFRFRSYIKAALFRLLEESNIVFVN